ncbi:MAG: hypothetical protein QOI66_1753 [Myxococcales bacterium]|nr:hypothetical protein [Myxococcales bacterium]
MSGRRSMIDPNDPNAPELTFDEKALASQRKQFARRGPSRRRFLASAAAAVGLPWLETLSGGNRAQAAGKPVRLVAWHTPNGYFGKTWYPATTGSTYTLSAPLMSLASLQKKLLVFQGIQNNDASVVQGSHGVGVSGMLTAVMGTKPAVKVGISVDQAFAQALPAKTTRIETGIQIGITNRMYSDIGNPAIYNGCISWANATQPMQPQIQPGVVFDQIFMGADPTATAAEGVRRRAIASSVLDHVIDEAKSLQGRLGATDRGKLDEYLAGVRSVETRIQSTTTQSCSSMGMTKPANTGLDWPTQTKISCDLMVMALQCDATRSISFMLGNGGGSCATSFPWLNISGDHHGLAHAQDANALPKIDAWHVSQLAYFCQKLDAIDEGGSTMLDNSLVFMSSEIMNGISHDQDNKGILLLGTAGGKLKTGQHMAFPKAPQGNLFVTMLNALGVPVTTFGTAGKAPLDGLLV